MLAQLAGLFIALAVAFVLASFAKSVLGRVPTHSTESNARGAASGLSLSEKRDYEQQLLRNRKQQQSSASSSPAPQSEAKSAPATESKPVMQPPRTDLAPPKDDPFTMEQLKEFDGADLSKPIYVAIKGASFPSPLAPVCAPSNSLRVRRRNRHDLRRVPQARHVWQGQVLQPLRGQGRLACAWHVQPQARRRGFGL